MKERRKQAAGTLSGGERQMLAVGRRVADFRLRLRDRNVLGAGEEGGLNRFLLASHSDEIRAEPEPVIIRTYFFL
ncbi:MAG: hypothetical protein CPDRYMAC_0187 [uncultured Paraburkholderia sp.]|nr:MAG: hypothetical protein CPDRYDRY_0186 [uncultured Paraburkholderia sp.]CAH2910344.1 MAG: hypothetical protein CPDRYMAC_0187 [uncultured Paraburkholderia sp.]